MIMKYLDACTSHLQKETIDSLDNKSIPFSYQYEEGVFITVPDKFDVDDLEELPVDLQRLLQYAWKKDVQLIRLDRDAEELEDLPTYEWKHDYNEGMNGISLNLLSEEQFNEKYSEKIGLHSDEAYEIMIDGQTVIGILMIDNSNPHYGGDCTFIDWVEIYDQFRGKSLFSEVLSKIFDLYKAEEIHFESCDENVSMYIHLGAMETGISELTENHMMVLNREDFKKRKSEADDNNVEKLWEEFEDVLFIENGEAGDSCDLVLADDWQRWNKGTTRDEIWRWFDYHHSKGIQWLLYGTK